MPVSLPGPRWQAAAALAAAAVAAVVLYRVDPAGGAWFLPPCPFLALTGLECPGCGSTRAVHQLLHGELGRALALNPLLVVYVPAIAWALADRLGVAIRGRGLPAWRPGTEVTLALLVVICGFGVLRNL